MNGVLALRWVFVLVVFAGLANTVLAQQSPKASGANQSSGIVFKSSVNRVILDVVVTDSKGKPVDGLKPQDFSVEEDGKPQTVLSFDIHDLDTARPLVFKVPPMPPNTFVNIPTKAERGPLYVLLLDLVNTEVDDQAFARQQLLKFVKEKPAGTRFALFVLSDGLHLVQGFTSDKDQLYAALNPSHPRPHLPRLFLDSANFGKGDPLLMIYVFTDLGRYLNGLPGRKDVLWVSGKFPVYLFPSDADVNMPMPDIHNRAIQALDALTRSEAAIYPVNVRGVVVFPEGRLTGAVPNGAATSVGTSMPSGAGEVSKAPASPGGPVETAISTAMSARGDSLSRDFATEKEVATITGGDAFYSRNDLAKVLDEATEMGAHYYTLTYSPSNKNYDGRLRKISVKLANSGYRLSYRRAYYATDPDSPIVPTNSKMASPPSTGRQTGDSLSAYMQYGAPIARSVIFRAHVEPVGPPSLGTPEQMAELQQQPAYFRARKKNHPVKPLAPIELQTYLIQYMVIGGEPNFEVAAGAYDNDGVLLNGDVEDASSAKPGSFGGATNETYYRIQQEIEVPLNAGSMRLAVHDLSTNRMGTIEFNLPLTPEPPTASSPKANADASASTTAHN